MINIKEVSDGLGTVVFPENDEHLKLVHVKAI